MAKKIKHNELKKALAEKDAQLTSDIQIQDSTVTKSSFTQEQIDKLTGYDELLKENARLSDERTSLIDRLGEYLIQIDDLKSELENKTNTKDDKDSIIKDLKNQVNELQKTIDEYLMKISDLSFENAKLVSQIQDIKSNHVNTSGRERNYPERINPDLPVYNPYKQNGYNSWN